MSEFKAKMHLIRFPLGAPLQTLLEDLTALPKPPWIKGAYFQNQRGKGKSAPFQIPRSASDSVSLNCV